MQLTNICRDVAEDAARDRVYLPAELLGGLPLARRSRRRDGRAVAELLRRADDFYASADGGLRALPLRCAIAIRAARLIYAEIGQVIARRGFDTSAGRAVVSGRARPGWPSRALFGGLWARGARIARRAWSSDRAPSVPAALSALSGAWERPMKRWPSMSGASGSSSASTGSSTPPGSA